MGLCSDGDGSIVVESVVGLCSDGDGSIVVEKWRGIE